MTVIEANIEQGCCFNPNIVPINGENVCINCGMVFERELVNRQKRVFDQQDIDNRAHAEPVLVPFTPRTLMGNLRYDSSGSHIPITAQAVLRRLSKINRSYNDAQERNLRLVRPKMLLYSELLHLPKHVSEAAWKIYSVAAKMYLTKGRSIESFALGALYIAIRLHEIPKILQDVVHLSDEPKKMVSKAVRLIIKDVLPALGLKYKPSSVKDLIIYFGNRSSSPLRFQKRAITLYYAAISNGLNPQGKNPASYAVAALYLALKGSPLERSQKELADLASIAEITLRSQKDDLLNHQ